MRFKFLTGDVNYTTYGGKWISNRQNNGEFDYYFVIELINWKEAVGREAPEETYNLSLSVVSPQEAGERNLKAAYDCCGIDEDMLKDSKHLAEMQVETLHSYSGGVPVWNSNGNNWRKLMKQARKEANVSSMLFGFVMDRTINGIGETGWEALKLTDPRDVLKRVLTEPDPSADQKLVGKMYGMV